MSELISPGLIPAQLLDSVVGFFHPRRVILFGSQARRDAGPDSDVDLLVELDDDAPAELLSAASVYAARKGFAGPVDIIPCRASVLASRSRAVGSFAHVILRDGVTVYERT